MLHALKIIDDSESPGPLLAFADDIVLLLESDISAAIALRAAESWASAALMRFNFDVGKSLKLRRGLLKPVTRAIGGEDLRLVESEGYRGVGVVTTCKTMETLYARVDGVSTTLATLKQTRALVHGMDLQ